MITYQVEMFKDVEAEMLVLSERHWKEVSPYTEERPLNIDLDFYYKVESEGRLATFTVRNDGKLVGYSYFIFVTLSHYKQITIAVNDTLYFDPDYRKGMVCYKFIKFAETQLVSLNVQVIMWRTKLGEKNFGTLLERLGYFPEEVSYTKMVNIKE